MANNTPTFVITGKVRLSYEHLVKPYANQPGAEEKFSVTLLIPKTDVATKQRIDAAIQAAVSAAVGAKWKVRPPQITTPLHDGDGVRQNGEPFGPECKGCWVMTASSKNRPEVVDIGLNPILDPTQIYSGIYARASINFFAYDTSGKRGIGCGLGNVQKLEDGEPLGNRTTAAMDFGADAASSPQQAAPTGYAQYAPPAPAYPQYTQPYGYQQTAPTPQQYAPIDPITGKPVAGGVMGL